MIGLEPVGSNAHAILQDLALTTLLPGVEVDLLANVVSGCLLSLVQQQAVPLPLKSGMLLLLIQSVQVNLVLFVFQGEMELVRKLQHAQFH